MVYETKEGPNPYMERSSLGIFGAIQISVRNSLGPNNPPVHEEETRGKLQRVCCRWKNVASMVQPPLTSREENSMFVDTLPSPYYDMLIVNTFVEFGELMYSVGRIEDGIKRGRIVDTGASKEERKRSLPEEHVQAMSGEKRRSHATSEEPVRNHPPSPGYTQVPFAGLQSP